MKNQLIALFFAFGFTLTAGCGGGGGGGGGGGSSQSASTGVRVLHGAIDASPVDLLNSANGVLVTSVVFGQESLHGQVGVGDSILTLTRAKSPGVVIATIPVSLAKNDHQSVLLYGDNQSFGLRTALIPDRATDLQDGNAGLRVVHGAVGASTVGILVDGGTSSITSSFGSASGYLQLPAGSHTVRISRTADGTTLYSGSVLLSSGSSYSLFVGGEVNYFTATRFLED